MEAFIDVAKLNGLVSLLKRFVETPIPPEDGADGEPSIEAAPPDGGQTGEEASTSVAAAAPPHPAPGAQHIGLADLDQYAFRDACLEVGLVTGPLTLAARQNYEKKYLRQLQRRFVAMDTEGEQRRLLLYGPLLAAVKRGDAGAAIAILDQASEGGISVYLNLAHERGYNALKCAAGAELFNALLAATGEDGVAADLNLTSNDGVRNKVCSGAVSVGLERERG